MATLLFDDFNRSDRTLDAPDYGPTPTFWKFNSFVGDWAIVGGRCAPGSANLENRAYWDVGATEYRLTVDVPVLPTDGGVGVRGNGSGSEVYVSFQDTVLKIYTYNGSSYTEQAVSTGGSPCAAGMTVTVDVTETSVTASTTTGLSVTWSSSSLSTQTQVSLRENNATVGRYDNLRVSTTGPAPEARYRALEVLPGSAALVNTATVARDGLDDVRAADEESVALYGHRAVTVDVALASDDDAEALASFHANRRSVPTPTVSRVDAVLAREEPEVLEALANLDLGDLVTVHRETVDGRVLDYSATVESLRWDLAPGRQTLSLSTAPSDTYGLFGSASWFLVGDSLLGGTAVLAPY